jgi:hypothetical protein
VGHNVTIVGVIKVGRALVEEPQEVCLTAKGRGILRHEANPSREENPNIKFWPSRLGVGSSVNNSSL